MVDLPEYLRERPKPAEYLPLVDARPLLLPFGEIPWEHFEALSLELFERSTQLVDARLYGGRGEPQEGIDLYGVTPAGEYETAQCRRVRKLTAGDIASVVDDFCAGPWAARSSRLVLFTAATTEERAVAHAIEAQRERLAPLGVVFTVRDRRELSRSLRIEPDLVDAYFGPGIRRVFCTGEDHVVARAEGAIETAEIVVAAARRPRIVDLGSLHIAVQKAVRELVEHDEQEFALVEPLLTDPNPAARAARWIAEPPEPIVAASWQLWVVVTRVAERGGEWRAGADGWLKVSELRGGDLRAIVNASIAAGVAGDTELETDLLGRARAIDPDHPKVKLQEAGQLEHAADQLAVLEGVGSDDASEQALIELNRAVAYLQLPDLAAAEAALRRAEESPAAGELLQLDLVRANAVVHRNRLATGRSRWTDAQAMGRAEADCLHVREALMAEHRFSESVRALMLAVDTAAVRFDFARAKALLEMATETEIAAPDGSGVLGDAALRCGQPHLALRFTASAVASDETRRIRTTARLALRQEVDEARAELRSLALAGGPEAKIAALALCKDAAFHRGPWYKDVAEVLASEAPIDAVLLEARHLAGAVQYDAAVELLDRHADDLQALQLRLELARAACDPLAIELVPRVLAGNPDRHHRLLCGELLMTDADGDVERAEAEIRVVAEDEAGSDVERSDAYSLLLRLLERAERWDDASPELAKWVQVDATDERLNYWQVKVGNRRRRS